MRDHAKFFCEFDIVYSTGQQRVTMGQYLPKNDLFPLKNIIHYQLVKQFSQKWIFIPKYVDLGTFFVIRHFCRRSHKCARIGECGGGRGRANLGDASILLEFLKQPFTWPEVVATKATAPPERRARGCKVAKVRARGLGLHPRLRSPMKIPTPDTSWSQHQKSQTLWVQD